MIIKGRVYEWLKWCAQILFPALGALYFGLAGIWDLPSAEQVVGTIVVVDAFLGVILGISQVRYNREEVAGGTLETIQGPSGKITHTLNLDDDPMDLVNKDKVVLSVVK